jgi:hypothetical protein
MLNMKTNSIKKGSTITYEKEIMFKGKMEVTANVVMIHPITNVVLLDNGDEFKMIGGQLYAI